MSVSIRDDFSPLSMHTANKLLANVFDACGQEPNTIPLDKLASYSEYRRERNLVQKILLAIVLTVFCLLPLCFVLPEYTVVRTSADDALSPIYEIRIEKSILPIRLVSASLNGKSLNVYESGERLYKVEPTENGTLTIQVELLNRQYDLKKIILEGIDLDAPELVNNTRQGDYLYLYISDENSGVDYEAIYGITNTTGKNVKPAFYDEEAGYVAFNFPEENMNILIPDKKGNQLQLVFTAAAS